MTIGLLLLGTVFCISLVKSQAQTCNSENIALAPFYDGETVFGPATSFCFSDASNLWKPISERPNPRFISNTLFQQGDKRGNRYNLSALFSFFGQALVSHDVNYSEELEETLEEPIAALCSETVAGESTSVCESRVRSLFGELVSEMKELLQIHVPPGDPWMTASSISVLPTDYDFLRTGRVCNWTDPNVTFLAQCSVLERKQFRNAISPALDGSVHYGSDTPFRIDFLRREEAGVLQCELLTFNDDGNPLKGSMLPSVAQSLDNHPDNAEQGQCLEVNNESGFRPEDQLCLAGDVRANENIGLLALETIFVREHNRLCGELETAFPAIEQRFQEVTVRIASLHQKIVYEEYLPVLLGPSPLPSYTGYNSSMSPQVSIWFDTVGFRFGHSEIPNVIPRLDSQFSCAFDQVALKDSYQAPDTYRDTGPDPIIAGLMSIQSEEIDVRVVDGLRNLLFGPLNLDLAAINIQRGRERGLCAYNSARILYGLAPVTRFEEITDDPTVVHALRAAYNGDVEQIDPWVGALAEKHADGATVGELISRILVDQFIRTRDGDPNFYKTKLASKPSLLQEIEETTFADVIRRNSRLQCIPNDVFHLPSAENPLQLANGSRCQASLTFPVTCYISTDCTSWMFPPCGGGIFLVIFLPLAFIAAIVIVWQCMRKRANLENHHTKMVDKPESIDEVNDIEVM